MDNISPNPNIEPVLTPKNESANKFQVETPSINEVVNELSSSRRSEITPVSGQPSATVTSSVQAIAQQLPNSDEPTTATTSTDNSVDAPHIADEHDLIEREWVIKAKNIVARTHDDPYTQNQEIGKFKADYQKKRFNRGSKLPVTT